jgi:hypothetical protein
LHTLSPFFTLSPTAKFPINRDKLMENPQTPRVFKLFEEKKTNLMKERHQLNRQ